MISKRIYIVFAFLFVFVTNVAANVNVTSGGNLNLCVGTTYTTIGNITIAEGAATDFSVSGSVQTYEINAPSNFEFNPSNGSVTASGADVTFSAVTVTATKITLIYFVNATATTDNFVLNGIQIRATNPSGSQNIVRTGGTAVQAGNNAGDNKVHAQVTSAGAYVSLNASSHIVCSNGSDINLNGSPGGGTYSGSSAITGNTFKPSVAGTGSYVITYTATNNGCVGIDTVHITVKETPSVTFFGLASSYCSNDSIDKPLTGFPAGGTFSGNGITNSSFFNPKSANVGNNKTVTYQYSANGCQGSYTSHTDVLTAPTNVSLNTSSNIVCSNGSDINLNGSPGGGTYSGSTGIFGSTFKPAVAGTGSYVITYTATNNSCAGTDTVHIIVKETPSVTFFGLASNYCSADNDAPLTGFPSGGTFSGNGIVNTSFFRPSNAGVGSNKSVTYQYTTNGCQSSTTLQTTVKQSPGPVTITFSLNKTNFFNTEDSILIDGNPSYLSPGGTLTVTGNGVVTDNLGVSRFYPKVIGQGSSTITRTLVATNGCIRDTSVDVTVVASTGNTIDGISGTVCQSANNITMTVSSDHGTYSVFYYNPLIGYEQDFDAIIDTDHSNGTGIFVPQKASIGTYLIEFVGVNNGLSYIFVQVIGPPTVTITNVNPTYCSDANQVTIQYTTTGNGTVAFSGNGVSNGKFNPGAITLYDVPTVISYVYTDVTGCNTSGTFNTTVFQAPQNVGFSNLNTTYCDKDPNSQIIINANIIPTGGKGVFSGIGIDTSNNAVVYNPSSAAILNGTQSSKVYSIIYTYTTKKGCLASETKSVTINKLPDVHLYGLTTTTSGEYCFGSVDINLNPTPVGGTISITAKTQVAITKNPLQLSPAQFQPSKGNPDTYYLKYTYTDGNQCTNAIVDTAIINPRPLVYFTGLKSKYCDKDSIVDLSAFPPASTGIAGTFASTPISSAIAGSKFIPSFAGVGEHAIKYSFTDNNGCSNDSSISTIVYGKPVPHSNLSSVCEGDVIQFRDAGSILASANGATSIINKWIWEIDKKSYTKQNLDTTLAAGSHSINYTTITNQGCMDTEVQTITIGSYPTTNFTWDKICNLEKTKFLNTTTINVGAVTNVVWNFSDGPKDSIVLGSGITGDTSHTFTTPATYNVILKAQSNYNCITIDTQKVFILPAVSITDLIPYSSDFEANTGGWVSSSEVDTLSSWALGIPSKSVINTTATGDHAWVTNVTGPFKKGEISYVYSPCFTLTDITKPMIHMDIWSGTRKNVSGANLQYSLNGDDWAPLGEAKSDGVNWYNNESNIVSRPSGASSLNQDGWTGIDSTGWKNVRHIFDNAIGNSNNIRFRVSFAGTDDVTDGFAFDNVWVGDRTRLMLAEHFTNNSNINTIVENNTLNNLITANLLNGQPKDIVELQYHTAFPGPDQMNARNIPDVGARALYYGVTQVPYSCIDGSYYAGNTLKIDQNMVNTRSLYDPAFNIALNTNFNSSNVAGSVTIENKISVDNTVTVYISLLERFINNIPGANGETNYQWVHAKFLPDAAGTSFAANWSAQSTQTINFNWDYTSANIYDPNKMALIVFVQDNVTQEIYQTVYKGLGASVTTGIFDPAEVSSTVSLYPNPANDRTTVILNGKLSGEYNWVITDELGRTIDQGKLKDETDGFTINTINYASGFYTLRLSNTTDGVKTQKFVVVH